MLCLLRLKLSWSRRVSRNRTDASLCCLLVNLSFYLCPALRKLLTFQPQITNMSEYWKSLPKHYCDFCKCWITDNKASRDFHERGFRHQGNVRKRVRDIQKNSTLQEKERQEYDSVIAKIEASALNSFQGDIARDPSLSKEIAHLTPNTKQEDKPTVSLQDKGASFNRFGQNFGDAESETLVNGKRRALETIAKAFEKKSKWLEAKTAEGIIYYWNKDTLETKHEAPKSGFLSIEEQNQFKGAPSSSNAQVGLSHAQLSKQYLRGGWKAIEKNEELNAVDLQLPTQDVSQIMLDFKQCSNVNPKEAKEEEKPAFLEKTVDTLKRPFAAVKGDSVSFKKRTAVKRNIRSRDPAD